jgi:hypothetical protein
MPSWNRTRCQQASVLPGPLRTERSFPSGRGELLGHDIQTADLVEINAEMLQELSTRSPKTCQHVRRIDSDEAVVGTDLVRRARAVRCESDRLDTGELSAGPPIGTRLALRIPAQNYLARGDQDMRPLHEFLRKSREAPDDLFHHPSQLINLPTPVILRTSAPMSVSPLLASR